MNREEIIRMAREKANAILLDLIGKPEWDKGCTEQHLLAFAALVAAAEREACAKRLEAVGCDHCAANIRAMGQSCPPCNHDCNEGRTCPARARA